VITINSLIKEYGNFRAVNNISLNVRKGEIYGFLGLNGAGKTTTLRILAGILKPTSGTMSLGGYDVATHPIEAKQITGFIPDRPYLYVKLSAEEFLLFVAELYSIPRDTALKAIDELITEYNLTAWRHELIESFSHGMKQRLATCAALLHRPKILIVDEPMVGLDPQGARLLKDRLRTYAKEGMTILLSTHSLNVAEEIADRIAIIHKGSILIEGELANIRAQKGFQNEDLEKIFLTLTSPEYQEQELVI
jgi:ABC-2 type transport system ATP-binding protein